MSNKTIPIDSIESAISEILKEYGDEVSKDVSATVDKITKEATKIVKDGAPVGARKGKYKKAITQKNLEKSPLTTKNVIWAGKEYPLSHLLEYGHQTARGRTAAQLHFKQGEEYIENNFERELREKIEK